MSITFKRTWILILAAWAGLLMAGCSSDGDGEGDLQALLSIEIDANCQTDGNVRVWVDGVYQFTLPPGGGQSLPAEAGTHHVRAESDAGRIWDQLFTVTRLDSTLVLTCD